MSRACQGCFRIPSAAAQVGSEESVSLRPEPGQERVTTRRKQSHRFSGLTGSGLYLRKQINELESLILTSATW